MLVDDGLVFVFLRPSFLFVSCLSITMAGRVTDCIGAGSGCSPFGSDVFRSPRSAVCGRSACHREATDVAMVSGSLRQAT